MVKMQRGNHKSPRPVGEGVGGEVSVATLTTTKLRGHLEEEKKRIRMQSGHFGDGGLERGRPCGRWWRDPESDRGHKDFQSSALPAELSRPNKC